MGAGLSQRAAASKIRDLTGAGVTQAMISQWERGEQRPSLDSLEALLFGLDCSLADLHHALKEVEAGGPGLAVEADPVDALLALADRQGTGDPRLRMRLRALLDLVDIGGLPNKLHDVSTKIGRLERLMRSEIENLERQVHHLRETVEEDETGG